MKRETCEEGACDCGGRDCGDGLYKPRKAKDHMRATRARGRKEGFPDRYHRECCQHFDFRLSLQNGETVNVCCFKPPSSPRELIQHLLSAKSYSRIPCPQEAHIVGKTTLP